MASGYISDSLVKYLDRDDFPDEAYMAEYVQTGHAFDLEPLPPPGRSIPGTDSKGACA